MTWISRWGFSSCRDRATGRAGSSGSCRLKMNCTGPGYCWCSHERRFSARFSSRPYIGLMTVTPGNGGPVGESSLGARRARARRTRSTWATAAARLKIVRRSMTHCSGRPAPNLLSAGPAVVGDDGPQCIVQAVAGAVAQAGQAAHVGGRRVGRGLPRLEQADGGAGPRQLEDALRQAPDGYFLGAAQVVRLAHGAPAPHQVDADHGILDEDEAEAVVAVAGNFQELPLEGGQHQPGHDALVGAGLAGADA